MKYQAYKNTFRPNHGSRGGFFHQRLMDKFLKRFPEYLSIYLSIYLQIYRYHSYDVSMDFHKIPSFGTSPNVIDHEGEPPLPVSPAVKVEQVRPNTWWQLSHGISEWKQNGQALPPRSLTAKAPEKSPQKERFSGV